MIDVAVHYESLTAKQKRVYAAIEAYIKTRGIPPTVREIGEMVGEKTPGAVQGILNRLEQKGAIKRQEGMARSIQLATDTTLYLTPVYIPELKKVTMRYLENLFNIYNIIRYHPVSGEIIDNAEGCFLIDCPDSKFFAAEDDYTCKVIFKREAEIKKDDIILVLYENRAVILTYLGSEDPEIIRVKSHDVLLNREIFKKDEIRIVGKLVAKIVKY
ncbi:MAG: LexA family transcriptional regulator [Clostridiales bacterium]|nr:LexA family transcriptional regulator [Clostridiales bacterium]